MPIEKYKLYDGKVEISFDTSKHLYLDSEGEIIPSATGITGLADKSAPLIWWAVNCYSDKLREMLKPGMKVDELIIEDVIEHGRKAHLHKKIKAATIGSMVHDWIHEYIKWMIENDKGVE